MRAAEGYLYIEGAIFSSSEPSIVRCVACQHPLDVFGQNVELDVPLVACSDIVAVGVAFGVRNDPNGKALCQELSDGETDAVDRDRAFVSRVMRAVGRQVHFETGISAGPLKRNHLRAAIDVTLH